MSRRRLAVVLSLCCIAALGVSAVAFAHGNGSDHKGPFKHARHAGKQADFVHGGMFGASVTSLAARLRVDPAVLRTAIRDVVAEQRAKRKAAAPTTAKPDLAALKTELATSLASKIGKTPDEVIAAVRAELDARLTKAVAAGWLTQKGHDLALACFDTPQTCDMKALKGEVRWFGHHRKHHHGKPDDGPSTSTPSTTSAPGSTSAPSGTMTPGGRSTSTPLR